MISGLRHTVVATLAVSLICLFVPLTTLTAQTMYDEPGLGFEQGSEETRTSITHEVKAYVLDAAQNFSRLLPVREPGDSQPQMAFATLRNKIAESKTKQVLEQLEKSLKSLKGYSSDGQIVNGLVDFRTLYGVDFANFKTTLMRVYDNNFPFWNKWMSEQNMVAIRKSIFRIRTYRPNSLETVEGWNDFYKSNESMSNLIFSFMQKAIDAQMIAGYPEHFVDQAASICQAAWNAHSNAWRKGLHSLAAYRKSRKDIHVRLKFWQMLSESQPEYFGEFLARINCNTPQDFAQILENAHNIINRYEDLLADRGEDAVTVAPETEEEEALGEDPVAPEVAEATSPAPEAAPLDVRLISVDVVNHVSHVGKTVEVRVPHPVLELVFDYDKMVGSYRGHFTDFLKPESEQATTANLLVSLGFVKTDNTINVYYPSQLQSKIVSSERVGNQVYIRKPVDLGFSVTNDRKYIQVVVVKRKIKVEATAPDTKIRVYRRDHFAPGYDRIIATIPIPLLD